MSELSKIFEPFFSSKPRQEMSVDICQFLRQSKTVDQFLVYKRQLATKYHCTLLNVNQVVAVLIKNGWISKPKRYGEYSLNMRHGEEFIKTFNDFVLQIIKEMEQREK